jgi:hypothetical protein
MVIKKNAQTSFRRAMQIMAKKNKRTDLLPFKDEAWFKKDFKSSQLAIRMTEVLMLYRCILAPNKEVGSGKLLR